MLSVQRRFRVKSVGGGPPPEAESSIHIPHDELIQAVREECESTGLVVKKEDISTYLKDRCVVAGWTFANEIPNTNGCRLTVGVANANDNGRFPLTFYVGVINPVDGIGVPLARRVLDKRHLWKGTPGYINKEIRKFVKQQVIDEKSIQIVKKRWLALNKKAAQVDEKVFLKAGRANLLAWSRCGRAWAQFSDMGKDKTRAGAILCFAKENRRQNPFHQMERAFRFVELVIATGQEEIPDGE